MSVPPIIYYILYCTNAPNCCLGQAIFSVSTFLNVCPPPLFLGGHHLYMYFCPSEVLKFCPSFCDSVHKSILNIYMYIYVRPTPSILYYVYIYIYQMSVPPPISFVKYYINQMSVPPSCFCLLCHPTTHALSEPKASSEERY